MNLLAAGSIGGTFGCIVAYIVGYKSRHLLDGPLRFVVPLHEVRRAQRLLVSAGTWCELDSN